MSKAKQQPRPAPPPPEPPPAQAPEPAPVLPYHFDGREFGLWFGGAGDLIPYLYLAKKARAGDADAAELLAAFGVVIRDSQGRRYYPPEG